MLALLSSVLWGTSDYMGGTLSRRLPPLAVVAVSQAFGLLLMVVVVLATGSWGSPGGYVGWAILASASGLTGLWAFYTALAMGTMAIVSPIAATGIVVPIIGGMLVGDTPGAIAWAGVATAIIGLSLVLIPQKEELDTDGPAAELADSRPVPHPRDHRRSIALAFVAALMFGTSLAAIAQGSLISPVMTMFSMRVFACIVLFTGALMVRSLGGFGRRDLPAAALIGFFDVGANLAYGLSAQGGSLVIAAVLGSLYPVVTVLLAWRLQHERLRLAQYVGVVVALVGVVLMSAS